MPELLPIVAQYAMDAFYTDYRSQSQFFDLPDFIFHCGATVTDIYQKEFKARYAELRAMKSDEVVGFPADWLLEEQLKVQRKDDLMWVELTHPVMSFTYDNQVIGVQEVLPIKPHDTRLERTTVAAKWQLEYTPTTSRIFWYDKGVKIFFIQKGLCGISEVAVLYIPGISETMLVPEGIIKMVVDQTVATMKALAQGTIVKKSNDLNPNEVMQLETNLLGTK